MSLASVQSQFVRRPAIAPVIAAAGHLGVWPALYAGAVLCCFLQLAGLWRHDWADGMALAAVVSTALGTYLIDRVKLAPGLMDPADRVSQPQRYAFLAQHDAAARALAMASLAGGALLALHLSYWAPLLIVASVIGTALYAPRPRTNRARIKDLLLVKNFYTATALVAFAAVISLITFLPGYRPIAWLRLLELPATIWAGAVLVLRVLIDAILCDIDDEAGDRTSHTHTPVTWLGKARVLQLTTIAQLLMACAMPLIFPLAPLARVLWSVSLIVSTLISLQLGRGARKDFVDLRFPVEAAIITLILSIALH